MYFNYKKLIRNKNELIIIILSILLGILFGIFDSLVSTFFFHDVNLIGQILTSNPNVIWKRSFVIIIVFINGLIFIKMNRRNQKTEDTLYESREIFKNVFKYSATGIALADKNGNFFQVNPSFIAITGYPEAELLNKNFRDITHPDDLEADLTLFRKLQNNEINNFTMEKRYLHKNGSYIWILLNASSIRNSAGEPVYYIAQIQNILERQEASFIDISGRDKAIYEKNRAYRDLNQIFNSVAIGMCLIDNEQNIARVNDSFLKLFQKNIEDVIGHKCYEIMNEIICNSKECPLDRLKKSDEVCKFESHKMINENTLMTFFITADVFTSPEGVKQGIIVSLTDITERKRLEAKIAEISETERRNLGQLLHDEVGQLLTGLSFRVEALKNAMEKKTYPEAADMKEISSLMKKVQSHTRKLMIGLYPIGVKYDRLLVALEDLAAETEKLFKIKCLIVKNGEIYVSDDSDITQLFYIAKESVHNAVKHAGATEIIITLSSKDNILTMLIQNNIKIRNDLEIKTAGLGLRIMEYRARLIGAKFEYFFDNDGFNVSVIKIMKKRIKNGKRDN